jgi:hypothetical protein
MNLTLISASIAFALGFGAAWQLQGHFILKAELEQKDARIERDRAYRAQAERHIATVATTQASAAKRVAAMAGVSDSNRTELQRLQSHTAESLRAAAGSLEACTAHSAAQGLVLNQCTSRLVEVAEVADGHASDAQTLMESWPE